jgi:hypothetical protein
MYPLRKGLDSDWKKAVTILAGAIKLFSVGIGSIFGFLKNENLSRIALFVVDRTRSVLPT